MRTLNYNHLYYFWTVAREGTIARAAEVLHLTPQTISGQLGEFEVRLEARLFSRNGRKLILTDVGRMVFDYADNIFQLGNELTDMLKRGTRNTSQPLRIGIVDIMPPLLSSEFIKPVFTFDNTSITCRNGQFDDLLAELSLHRIDIILSDTPLSSGGNIRAYNHHLGDSGIAFFAASDHVRTYRDDFPACLDKAPLLLPTMETPLRRSLEQWFRKAGITPAISGEFEDSTLQRYLGEAGAGIFVAPSVMKQQLLSDYAVECIADVDDVTESYYLVSTERRLQHPAAVAIFDNARNGLLNGWQDRLPIQAAS